MARGPNCNWPRSDCQKGGGVSEYSGRPTATQLCPYDTATALPPDSQAERAPSGIHTGHLPSTRDSRSSDQIDGVLQLLTAVGLET